ncbi:hypothetical protein PENTCL1PPCAC_23591, partial [Pristionchus entomophagus]
QLLPILFLPQVSESMKMVKLKSVIQYVVNDRHSGLRERLYIRPLLIHHFCNGFSIDFLLSLYEHRITLTQPQLVKYCTIFTKIYKKAGKVIHELMANHSKCDKIISIAKKDKKTKEQADLTCEMTEKFPFLLNQWIPPTSEKMAGDQTEWKRTGCDFYIYYTFFAITQLHELGYLLSDVLISEIVRITVHNIPSSVCCGLHARLWAVKYIQTVIKRNKARL